jgi:hypothetical protein
MDLYSEIIAVYPELTITGELDQFKNGIIQLKDDGDGIQYIAKWAYSKPLPKSLVAFLR